MPTTEFKLPELGENVTAGDVVRVLVKPGDGVAKDQPVLELETDKATIEVPSTVSGTVKDVKVKTGETVKVGQSILTVEEGAGAGEKTEIEGSKRERGTEAKASGPKTQPAEAVEEGGVSQKATTEAKPERGAAKAAKQEPEREEEEEEEEKEEKEEAPRQKRGEVVDM